MKRLILIPLAAAFIAAPVMAQDASEGAQTKQRSQQRVTIERNGDHNSAGAVRRTVERRTVQRRETDDGVVTRRRAERRTTTARRTDDGVQVRQTQARRQSATRRNENGTQTRQRSQRRTRTTTRPRG